MISKLPCYLRSSLLLLASSGSLLASHPASAEWNYGLGSGIFQLNVEGDQGFNTQLAGPVVFRVDLDPKDISDLMDSALGFGGYATNGKLMIQYSLTNLALQGEASRTVGSVPVSARLGFDVTGGEVTFGYPLAQSPSAVLRVLGGVRYLEHELSSDLAVGSNTRSRSQDHNWTDLVVGLTMDMPFGEKWSWNGRIDVSGGGSEGSSLISTGVTWRFVPKWTSSLFVKSQSVELENGVPGDSDFYLYDADEFGWGINFLHHW